MTYFTAGDVQTMCDIYYKSLFVIISLKNVRNYAFMLFLLIKKYLYISVDTFFFIFFPTTLSARYKIYFLISSCRHNAFETLDSDHMKTLYYKILFSLFYLLQITFFSWLKDWFSILEMLLQKNINQTKWNFFCLI